MNWLSLAFICYLDRVCTKYKGQSGLQDKIQAVHIFATKVSLKERDMQSEHQYSRASNDHREHRASRRAGDGAHRGRESGKL